MHILPAIGAIFGIGSAVASIAKGAPKPQIIQPQRAAVRDDALTATSMRDEMRRRKGAAADLITGTGGAEAAAGQVGRLVIGS